MNIQRFFLLILAVIIIVSGGNEVNGQTSAKGGALRINPFEIDLYGNGGSMSPELLITLTDKQVKVIKKGISAGEKDSVVYSAGVKSQDTLQQIGEMDPAQLKGYYANKCIDDGAQLSVIIKKDGKTKSVFISNYYLEEVGSIIYFVNARIPEKYRIWYDKEKLIKDYNSCNGN